MRFIRSLFLMLFGLLLSCTVFARGTIEIVKADDLPQEAQQTIVLIKQGGPFPYSKDGAVYGNYEGLLPRQRRGYYHEFTVQTPSARNRGARRIVTGGQLPAPAEYYYTDNHYASFKRIKE